MDIRSSDKLSSSLPSPSSSCSSSSSSSATHENDKQKNSDNNLKETELRLGLPGSLSPERKTATGSSLLSVSLFGKDLEEKHGNNVVGCKNVGGESGSKRGFSDVIDVGCRAKWGFSVESESDNNQLCGSRSTMREAAPSSVLEKKPLQVSDHSSAPSPKAQVVGWPPIRSFRKNSVASNLAKTNEETEEKSSAGCLYVKVGMDGAPYLRKVDLKSCKNYQQLSSALEKMFSCFTIGKCGSTRIPERNGLNESRLLDLLHGSEFVVTYEDKDGDWMLVGDVPWEMFTATCRRLRIMKGSEAIGLVPRAPRATEKCTSWN